MLEILYQDEYLVAINKPAGLLVHKSRIAAEEKLNAMHQLRDQLGQWVYPIHRLDRPTSGVLLFALDKETATEVQEQFSRHTIKKHYLAVVRGVTPIEAIIDVPLEKELDQDTMQEAETYYKRLATVELDIAVSRYPTSRYSLIEVVPKTGRMHQIRRHMAKSRHYIIGDTKHGDNKHNKMFRENFEIDNLLLHAYFIEMTHPKSGEPLAISAPLPEYFDDLVAEFGWTEAIYGSDEA
ncbi:pseudouridine synthase [Penaeicola halotolerans]|uniref:pseudouridine synthase n=1 Tax=Penaeicola halotolerans TaxID=2793196 RepID=UPI001CF80DDD|nr:pseudouridine synthase [Penaeicola halotolerans]